MDEGPRDEYRSALGRAYDWLARRPCTGEEIRLKLGKAGVSPEVAERVLATLMERRFVDDGQLAGDSVQSLATRKGWGRRKIEQRLRQRGISEDVVAQALDGLAVEDEAAQAGRLAKGLRARGKRPEQVYRFLISRGFPAGLAREAALSASDGPDEEG